MVIYASEMLYEKKIFKKCTSLKYDRILGTHRIETMKSHQIKIVAYK